MFEVIIGFLTFAYFFYKWWTSPKEYWKKRGVKQLEYVFPYGCYPELIKMNIYQGYVYEKIYNEMGDMAYAGIVLLRRPHLLLKDPEIIKSIFIKDFEYFTDRMNVDNIKEPLSHHLFNLGGDKWKALRVKLTPTFTSGKLKIMFPLFEMCSKSLEETLDDMVKSNTEIDVKDIIGRYTTKIIGTCAYGIDIDSLGNKDNEFVRLAANIFGNYIPFARYCVMLSQYIFPGIEKLIKYRFSTVKMETFLTTLVSDAMSFREKSDTKRNDFIDLLMEIRTTEGIIVDSLEKEGKTTVEISDLDLIAQVFVFLGAGFETSSSVTSYCLFELAQNLEIQEKLRKEILNGLPLTYQSLHEMHYLDMVVNETMRKYPTLPLLSRKCTKPYRLPNGSVLEKDIRVIIPVYALHHDPRHFPDPDRFDPDRFTQENKNSRHPYCYLPFGEGPRHCIGMRFGLLQTKMGLATILAKYQVKKTVHTRAPLEFVSTPLISSVSHPIKLGFKKLT